MQEIILASNNKHKLQEVRKVLKSLKIISLKEIGFNQEIPETANTFQGNAKIKCEAIYNKFKCPVISDDSGLAVDYLGGNPGVFSSRYAGQNATDIQNYQKLLEELKGVANRKAKFVTTICFYQNPEQVAFFSGELLGHINQTPKGENGFGYDPVFVPEGHNITLAEMSLEQKNLLSHRYKALQKFKEAMQI